MATVPLDAQASSGPVHTNFTTSYGIDGFCGLDVQVTQTGVDNFFPVVDSAGNLVAYKDVYSIRYVFSANGKSIDMNAAGTLVASAVNNADGTTTITATYTGLPERWAWPGGSTITRDAGSVTVVDVVAADGTLLSETYPRIVGPHPEVDSGFALICQVVTAALT
jgi:hypothetical protein